MQAVFFNKCYFVLCTECQLQSKMRINWKGKGIKEKGYDEQGNTIIECDKNYLRPLDVNTLLGNASKARKKLSWKPKTNIHKIIDEMILDEINTLNA